MSAPKLCIPTVIRRDDHPWDPDVVEYDVLQMIDGEPNYLQSGQRIGMTVTGETTMDQIQSTIEADATSRSWIP